MRRTPWHDHPQASLHHRKQPPHSRFTIHSSPLTILPPGGSPVYTLTMVLGIALGAWFWIRQSRSEPRHAIIYFAAIAGAFLGAKVAYLLSEGWLHTDPETRLLHWLTGKSVTGALLGGWLAVELAKVVVGYRQSTGDRYALIVPPGIILGRLGCLAHGCCQGMACDLGALSTHAPDGTPRWPAVPVEILFNLLAFLGILILRHRRLLPGQHFHLYLFCYGLFRFAHDFLRATPKPFLGLSGYQLLSLTLSLAAAVAFVVRARTGRSSAPGPMSACTT